MKSHIIYYRFFLSLVVGLLLCPLLKGQVSGLNMNCKEEIINITADPYSTSPLPGQTKIAAEFTLTVDPSQGNQQFQGTDYVFRAGQGVTITELEMNTGSELIAEIGPCNVPWSIYYDSLKVVVQDDNSGDDEPYLLTIGFVLPINSDICPEVIMTESPCFGFTNTNLGDYGAGEVAIVTPAMGEIVFSGIPTLNGTDIANTLNSLLFSNTNTTVLAQSLLNSIEDKLFVFGAIALAIDKDHSQDYYCDVFEYSLPKIKNILYATHDDILSQVDQATTLDDLQDLLKSNIVDCMLNEISETVDDLSKQLAPENLPLFRDEIIGAHVQAYLNLDKDYFFLGQSNIEDTLIVKSVGAFTAHINIYAGIDSNAFSIGKGNYIPMQNFDYNKLPQPVLKYDSCNNIYKLKDTFELTGNRATYHLGCKIDKGYNRPVTNLIPFSIHSICMRSNSGITESEPTSDVSDYQTTAIEVELRPNPAASEVFLHITALDDQPLNCHIYDDMGRLVGYQKNLETVTGTTIVRMDISNLSLGTYTAVIATKGAKPITKRFVKANY